MCLGHSGSTVFLAAACQSVAKQYSHAHNNIEMNGGAKRGKILHELYIPHKIIDNTTVFRIERPNELQMRPLSVFAPATRLFCV